MTSSTAGLRSNGVSIVRHVLWFLGVMATGFYVVIFCGFTTFVSLKGGGFDLSRSLYSIHIVGASAAWVVAILVRILWRGNIGFVISTIMLGAVAVLAVSTIFFIGVLSRAGLIT